MYLIKAFPLSSKFFHSSNDEQAGENKIWIWKSDGESNFTIEETEDLNLLESNRGTKIDLNLSRESKECYMGEIAPSGPLHGKKTINQIKETNPDDGYNNFARVTIHVSKMDVLLLHHLGHRRIEFKLSGKRPIHQWLAS